MPLPNSDTKWPPTDWLPYFEAYQEWAAWYSASPDALANYYGGYVTMTETAPWWRFWNRAGRQRVEQQSRSQLHMPLASDMAQTSSALLFGEAAGITIAEAHEETAATGSKETEERLHEIIREGDIENRLIEAADTCAALGGVFLKVDWDVAALDIPILTVVQADNAIPEFRYGRLVAVTLWRVVEVENQTVWRHMERHEPGTIEHGLYKGRADNVGQRLDLTAHDATAELEELVRLPFGGLAIRYIPNLKPNRRFRGSELGQSDYAGAEGLLDALDETWTSWMRDIRLAKARLLVPSDYLEGNAINGFSFNIDQEVFTPLDITPGDNQGITASQFAIRVDEHERTAMALIEQIVGHAGYAPQTFGLHIEGRAETGTALRVRERKTLMTQQKKVKAWPSPLADLFEMMLIVDRVILKNQTSPFRPQITMADSLTPDETETATTVEIVNRAGAASTETLVKMLHPSWDQERVDAEVTLIREEKGLALPDPMQIGIA